MKVKKTRQPSDVKKKTLKNCVLELGAGQSSQGFPQAPPSEQQQEARVTPTPISALQEIPPSPRASTSRKQFPTRVSGGGGGGDGGGDTLSHSAAALFKLVNFRVMWL